MADVGTCATRWGAGLSQKIDNSGEFIKVPYPLPSSCHDASEPGSPIQEFFRGGNILVTGATGFMGKILVEKLIASCPGIEKVYVIIREKKGMKVEERLNELLNCSAFDRLRQTVPDFKDKISAIHGDCSQPFLGLSTTEYKNLTEIITVVFHGAATVKFNEKLHDATVINVAGVREVLNFCKLCKNLKSVVHTSTAYSNCIAANKIVDEKFYPAPKDYKEVLQLSEQNPEELNRLEGEIISPWPNTYSFTKKLAEDLIKSEATGLPIVVYRPGIVVASYQEPTPGWSDNIYGPTAVTVGNLLGAIRVIHCDRQNRANVVPVDLAVNGLIAAAWKAAESFRESSSDIPILNFVSESRNPITWGEFCDWNVTYGWNWPSVFGMWYPVQIYVQTPFSLAIAFFLFHTLPAYLIDAVLWLSRKKPLMVATNQKISKFYELLSFFGTNTWSFKDQRLLEVWKNLSPLDQTIFPFDIAEMDWDKHCQTQVLGLRVHVVKDPIDTLEKGRRKMIRLHIQHRLVQLILFAIFVWILYKLF